MKTYGVNDIIGVTIAKHGLTVESEFVPWSRSRNAGEKYPSLNWRVTLLQHGKKILTTDYGAGMGHCPSYTQGRMVINQWESIKAECEKGKSFPGAKPINPDSHDVIYSLLIDSEVLDHPCYEDWAGEFGYDEDSRKGEQIYNACMKIALQFRRIGESTIEELREAFQDY